MACKKSKVSSTNNEIRGSRAGSKGGIGNKNSVRDACHMSSVSAVGSISRARGVRSVHKAARVSDLDGMSSIRGFRTCRKEIQCEEHTQGLTKESNVVKAISRDF